MIRCVLFDLDDTLLVVGRSEGVRSRARLLDVSAAAVLEELATRMSLGIVTSCPTPHAIRALRETGILSFFRYNIVGSESVHRPKPHPMGLRLAMKRANALPETTVFIGNSLDDCEAASAAGVSFYWAGWAADVPHEAAQKSKIVGCLRELLRLCSGEISHPPVPVEKRNVDF